MPTKNQVLDLFLDEINQNKKGFVVAKDGIALYSFPDKSEYSCTNYAKQGLEEFVSLFLDLEDIEIGSYPLDEESAIIVIDKPQHTIDEGDMLYNMMKDVKIHPDNKIISSIVGISYNPPVSNLHQSEFNLEDKSKNILLPDYLTKRLDEILQSKFALGLGIKNKEQMIAAGLNLITDNLGKEYHLKAKSQIYNKILDITIFGNFPKCNECNSFDCEHIEMFFKSDQIIAKMRENKMNPIRFKVSKQEFTKKETLAEMDS